MNKAAKKIQKIIDQIVNPYPSNRLIKSYSDFLQYRDSLPYYQFNSKVLENLLDLSLETWKTKKRISRFSIITLIKKFSSDKVQSSVYLEGNARIASSNPQIRKKVFQLFINCFDSPEMLTEKQLPEARKICNGLLLNVELGNEEVDWLCTNYQRSVFILNRILRHPEVNPIISSWAIENYHNDALRNRRAELLSWILDEQPNFNLEQETLLQDFHYFNAKDRMAVMESKENFELNFLLANQIGLTNEKERILKIPGINPDAQSVLATKPIKLTKRFYNVPTKFSDEYLENFPDFDKLDIFFIGNLNIFFRVTMLWAIGYSRLNSKKKSQLLIKYYCAEVENTYTKICIRCKLVEPLEWLKDSLKVQLH